MKAQLAAAQALPPGPGGAAAAPPQPARPLSAASSGAEEDSASYQLHLSISETVPQRLPSVSTGEVVVQLSAAITPGAARRTAAEQAQTSPLRPSLQRHHPNGSARSAAAAGRGGAWARSPLQRRLEPPPEPEAPAAEEVWPVEEPPQAVPPTDVAELPGSDQDEDVDVTQAVPPPAAQVICTQLPPPAQQQGLWQPRQQDQAAAKHARSILAKRQIDVEPITAAAGSMGPPPSLQSKRRAVSPSEAQHEALLPPQHELSSPPQQHRREQQLEHDHEWSPLASTPDEAAAAELAAAAVPVQAVDWGGQGQRVQQAVAWPDARPSGQQQPQQLRGGGWKQAVRDHAPAHAAFDLRAPAGGSGVGGMAGHQRAVPPLREANGPPAGSRAGGSGNGGGGNSGTGYRYQAVVRKKAEREKLQVGAAECWVAVLHMRRWQLHLLLGLAAALATCDPLPSTQHCVPGLLQGVECQQCKRFYAALESWGTIGQEQVRLACGHVQRGVRRLSLLPHAADTEHCTHACHLLHTWFSNGACSWLWLAFACSEHGREWRACGVSRSGPCAAAAGGVAAPLHMEAARHTGGVLGHGALSWLAGRTHTDASTCLPQDACGSCNTQRLCMAPASCLLAGRDTTAASQGPPGRARRAAARAAAGWASGVLASRR